MLVLLKPHQFQYVSYAHVTYTTPYIIPEQGHFSLMPGQLWLRFLDWKGTFRDVRFKTVLKVAKAQEEREERSNSWH